MPPLPASGTTFVGRALALAQVKAILNGSRLVTLTGPAGSGKTRLALQAAVDLLPAFGGAI